MATLAGWVIAWALFAGGFVYVTHRGTCGECDECGRPAEPGSTVCADCARAGRLAAGACRACTWNPRIYADGLCVGCYYRNEEA